MTATSSHRIDHVVVAVEDLDLAGAFYEKLGFTVGARNRHPWGTENRLIQFKSSFVELITVGDAPETIPPHREGHFSFGAFVRDYLRKRQGFAMFVLDSPDAKAERQTFVKQGIGDYEPFFFERRGKRPDGSETHVAFTLAFASDPTLPDASFFVCEQHFPENFWNPQFQNHRNGASNIAEVQLGTKRPADHARFLENFTGVKTETLPNGDGCYRLQQSGALVATRDDGIAGFTGFTIAVPDIARQCALLSEAGIDFAMDGERVVIAAAQTFGTALSFSAGR